MKYILKLISINAIFSIFYTIYVGFKRFAFLNCSFTIGMLYLLFGILCFIWEKGFFNITLFSFNKIFQQTQKRNCILVEESDLNIEEFIYKKNSFIYTYHLLSSGFVISLITTIISFSI
ncbi:MAG: DUF3899 domain-containing protein [Romboutsia sp.]